MDCRVYSSEPEGAHRKLHQCILRDFVSTLSCSELIPTLSLQSRFVALFGRNTQKNFEPESMFDFFL